MGDSAFNLNWTGVSPDSCRLGPDGWSTAAWDVPAGKSFAATCRWSLPETVAPFWCIPGLFWGDNQQDTTGQYYPRFRAGLSQPRQFQSSFWEFHVWRAAQPLVALHDGTTWWILEVEPNVDDLSVSVGFEFDGGHPALVASLPASERPYRHVGHD